MDQLRRCGSFSLVLFVVLGQLIEEGRSQKRISLNPDGSSVLGGAFRTTGWECLPNDGHSGDDFFALDCNKYTMNLDAGETILSVSDGVVRFVERDEGQISPGQMTNYGNNVVVQLSKDPAFLVRYAHLDKVFVFEGQDINLSDPIGTLGTSGLTGQGHFTAHLHLALYRNANLRPTENCRNGRELELAEHWLSNGLTPCRLDGDDTSFAAPFSLDSNIWRLIAPAST